MITDPTLFICRPRARRWIKNKKRRNLRAKAHAKAFATLIRSALEQTSVCRAIFGLEPPAEVRKTVGKKLPDTTARCKGFWEETRFDYPLPDLSKNLHDPAEGRDFYATICDPPTP